MKKASAKPARRGDDDMRAEYDFGDGVRGKHHRAMQAGYTITIHQADGAVVVEDVSPDTRVVILEPDVRPYFPDSEAVNKALRCLVPLLITRTISGLIPKMAPKTQKKDKTERLLQTRHATPPPT